MRHEYGQRARDHEMVERAQRVLDDPVPLLLIDHLATPFGEHARGTRVDDEEPGVAEVAVVGPAARGRLPIAPARELPQTRTGIIVALDEVEHLLLGELGRRQIAEVLVDPVRHERARDPRVPPRLFAHLLHPLPGDVPVVIHVVVVEDHRRRHRREQPADVRVRPRLPVETRVLLEVRDLLARGLAYVAPRRMNSSVAGDTSSA